MSPIDHGKGRRAANKPNQKGKNRTFSTPEDIQAQLEELKLKKDKEEEEDDDEDEETSSDEDSSEDESDSDDESTDSEATDSASEDDSDEDTAESGDDAPPKKPPKAKGVSSLIEVKNPNRNPKKLDPTEKVELTRREREELEKQRKRDNYSRLAAQGKTEEAKADLERLAVIRAKREAEAAKRREEQRRKEEAAAAKKAEVKK